MNADEPMCEEAPLPDPVDPEEVDPDPDCEMYEMPTSSLKFNEKDHLWKHAGAEIDGALKSQQEMKKSQEHTKVKIH